MHLQMVPKIGLGELECDVHLWSEKKKCFPPSSGDPLHLLPCVLPTLVLVSIFLLVLLRIVP